MTSFRRILANRRNAEKSTGPRTAAGKAQSRRNALRHGLCAETVIAALEDAEDYKAFELAITADYDARTAVERELVLRLASLLWRLRRATFIETDLLSIQAEILLDREPMSETVDRTNAARQPLLKALASVLAPHLQVEAEMDCSDHNAGPAIDSLDPSPQRELTYSFQRLANLDNGLFERLGRYQSWIWRKFIQTLFALQMIRRRLP